MRGLVVGKVKNRLALCKGRATEETLAGKKTGERNRRELPITPVKT